MTWLQHLAGSLVARPAVYDAVQTMLGSKYCYGRLRRLLPDTVGLRVLDVGAGTGLGFSVLSATARHVCLDIDLGKLIRLRSERPTALAVRADAQALPLEDGVFDICLCVFLCHHLENTVLLTALREVARVCRGPTLIMEPLWAPRRPVSSLLWRYDQGAFPRTREALVSVIETCFEIERVEEFAVFHRYLLCRCWPSGKT